MNKLKDTSINVCFIDNIPDNVQEYLKNKLTDVKNVVLNFSSSKNQTSVSKNVLNALLSNSITFNRSIRTSTLVISSPLA